MSASSTDLLQEVGLPGSATNLAGAGYTIGDTSITVTATTNHPTATGYTFAIDVVETDAEGNEVRVDGSYCEFVGIVTSATTIGSVSKVFGDDQDYSAGANTRVYIPVSSERENRIVEWGLTHANQDGSLKTSAVQSALNLGSGDLNGWLALGYAPNTVTYNGNRSYDLVFNSVDLTSTVSNGMRLRTTRTVAAPNQCASLNGTNQYFSKTSPSGMTFTDDFVVSAWVKLSSYAQGVIASRYNGTSGWQFRIDATGQVSIYGWNAGAANFSGTVSYQSIPLNKWVHVTAQLDMSAFTASSTTSYVMIDAVDVPCSVTRSGTNPTSLIQAGNLEIGSTNGGSLPFPGKIAQVAIYSAKVTQANIRATISQGLTGSETNLVSAYSLSNSLNDLNTGNANNLTAQNSAATTNADSPFGNQADGTISTTLDYAIVQKTAFSTNTTLTVQVPEGCTIPTTGGVTSVVYSSNKAPYGMPIEKNKWQLITFVKEKFSGSGSLNTWGGDGKACLTLPTGSWDVNYNVPHYSDYAASSNEQRSHTLTLSTTNNTETDTFWTTVANVQAASVNPTFSSLMVKHGQITVSTQTPYYIVFKESGSGGISNNIVFAITSVLSAPGHIIAENAYL